MSAALGLEDVRVTYPSPTGDVHALDGMFLDVPAGTSAAVLGRSGSGKSTFLSVAATLRTATSGRVTVGGVEVGALEARDLAAFRARTIGVVFQRHHLDPTLSALENVLWAWGCAPGGRDRRSATTRALSLLDELGVAECAARRPHELSGGQCQRVAIARAVLGGPLLLLADEPTGNLDEESAGMVVDLLLELVRRRGTTLVVVTHDRFVADRLDTVIRIARGRTVDEGPDRL